MDLFSPKVQFCLSLLLTIFAVRLFSFSFVCGTTGLVAAFAMYPYGSFRRVIAEKYGFYTIMVFTFCAFGSELEAMEDPLKGWVTIALFVIVGLYELVNIVDDAAGRR